MRYTRNGPDIPESLLQAQTSGKLVLFCGAGVSKEVGLPTFSELTKHILDTFHADKDSPAMKYFNTWADSSTSGHNVPFDSIFTDLHNVFGEKEVNDEIAKHLVTLESKVTRLTHFSDILDISTSTQREFSVVTTNFDRLLERANAGLFKEECVTERSKGRIIINNGIAYLHGRINSLEDSTQNFVLSRKDYSKTYLLEGHALEFLKDLFRNNTVVFIGYRLGDTLVQYIIDGISDSASFGDNNAYIFVEESSSEVLGASNVTCLRKIAYNSHWDLWETIHQWAKSTRDPDKWKQCLLKKSSLSPGHLEPFERRQVVDMINGLTDTKALLSAGTSPEWLLVLDGYYRSGSTLMSDYYWKPLCKLLENYSLDNDPRPELTTPRELQCDDTYSSYLGDETSKLPKGVSTETKYFDYFEPTLRNQMVQPFQCKQPSTSTSDRKEITKKFASIVPWLSSNFDNPITAWWIIWREFQSLKLFSEAAKFIKRSPEMDQIVSGFWSLVVNHMRGSGRVNTESNRRQTFKNLLDKKWGIVSDEDFKMYVRYFLCSGHFRERLAECDLVNLTWDRFTLLLDQHWEDCCAHRCFRIALPPNDRIHSVFKILEAHYKKCYEIRKSLRLKSKGFPTCYPDEVDIGDSHNLSPDPVFRLFTEISVEMAGIDLEWLKKRMQRWPKNDYQYFHKVVLRLMATKKYCKVQDVAEFLEELSDEEFWNPSVRRELLSLVASRANKRGIMNVLERLLQPERDRDNKSTKVVPGCSREGAASCIVWLILNDVVLLPEQNDTFSKMPHHYAGCTKEQIPIRYQYKAWPVEVDRDKSWLDERPVNMIADVAELEGKFDFQLGRRRDDFGELTRCHPAKALAFLTTFSRKGEYPVVLWKALLWNWPANNKTRLNNVMLKRVSLVPKKVAVKYLWPLVEWLERYFVEMTKHDLNLAWSMFDYIVEVIAMADSLRDDMSSPIDGANRESILYINASDSCVEKLMRCVREVAWQELKTDDNVVPSIFKEKIAKLIACGGMVKAYTVAILGSMYGYLYGFEKKWTYEYLDHFFDYNNEYASFAWSGFLWTNRVPHSESNSCIFRCLEHVLFEEHDNRIVLGDLSKNAAEIVAIIWIFGKHMEVGLNNDRVRVLIRKMGIINRMAIIDILAKILKEEGECVLSKILSFAKDVWPRDKGCRSAVETVSWMCMLSETGGRLPHAYNVVKKYLVPVDVHNGDWLTLYTKKKSSTKSIAEKFPETVLEMMYMVYGSCSSAPVELRDALEQIEKSGRGNVDNQMLTQLKALVASNDRC